MASSKNRSSLLLKSPLVLLPFLFACGSGGGKPAASAGDAEGKADSAESANADSGNAKSDKLDKSDKSDMGADEAAPKADEKSEAKSEAKSEGKKDKKSGDGDEAEPAPKDDSRSTAACEKVIKDNRKAFKKCYSGRSDLKGELTLRIELDAAGKIKKAFIDDDSTVKDDKVQKCILDLAKTLTFPASTKGLTKDFEYNFGINNKSE